jgi:hypothetical protein
MPAANDGHPPAAGLFLGPNRYLKQAKFNIMKINSIY